MAKGSDISSVSLKIDMVDQIYRTNQIKSRKLDNFNSLESGQTPCAAHEMEFVIELVRQLESQEKTIE